jgi:hypothetical protein
MRVLSRRLQRGHFYEARSIAVHYDGPAIIGKQDQNGSRSAFTNQLVSLPQTHSGAVIAQQREEDGANANPLICLDGCEAPAQLLLGGEDHWSFSGGR